MTQISEEQKIMLDNLRRAVKEKVARTYAAVHPPAHLDGGRL